MCRSLPQDPIPAALATVFSGLGIAVQAEGSGTMVLGHTRRPMWDGIRGGVGLLSENLMQA